MVEGMEGLLDQIRRGQILQGTYILKTYIDKKSKMSEELTVRTINGTEYYTQNEQDRDLFFKLIDYSGCCVNSETLPDGCYYESMACWKRA